MAEQVDEIFFARKVRSVVQRMALAVVLVLVISSRSMAQTNPSRESVDSADLVIEAVVGWGGIVDRSTPVPISFLIRNDSAQSIDGILTLTEFMNGNEVNLGEFSVAPGTTRRVTSIQAMSGWFECFATFSRRGKVLWRRELDFKLGSKSVRNANFVLFVDDAGRRMQLPGAVSETDASANQDLVVAGSNGRPIHCVSVKPWQLPNHPGPLIVAQALVFPEGASERDLNAVQWRTIADWMCQGGTIFVHEKSAKIIDRVVQSAPLDTEPAVQIGPFAVRRFGLGAMYEYAEALFSSGENEIRQAIANTARNLARNPIDTFADAGPLNLRLGERADQNRLLVGAFFGFYTFLIGFVSLFLFRLSQRKIAIYTIIVVVGASILSGLLGGLLRSSKGDLNWLTVTQPGVGGLVQVGTIELMSGGSRNSRIAVKGEHADVQAIEADTYYDYSFAPYSQPMGYSPFTWQRNLSRLEKDAYQINLPISLWGRRRCHAMAFKRGMQPMDIEVQFEPHDRGPANSQKPPTDPSMPEGTISLQLVNRLPFDLKDCWLVVGITRASPQPEDSNTNQPNYRNQMETRWPVVSSSPVDGMIDVYHVQKLPDLAQSATHQGKFPADFQHSQSNWELLRYWPYGSHIPPRISRMGTASAWIIGRAENLPIIAIDEQHSDFVPGEQIHLFIQEVLPEEMPETLQFKANHASSR